MKNASQNYSIQEWYDQFATEVELSTYDDFLKIVETLTRIGIASNKNKQLFQTCHILHKRGKYYIVHFKELFILDGFPVDISDNDIERKYAIINLLADWGMIDTSAKTEVDDSRARNIKVLTYSQKKEWKLVPKYTIGNK